MTNVMFVGLDDVNLESEFLAYETARNALSPYTITSPYANTLEIETISIGSAVSLLNDLNWYLVRLVKDAIILEPSVSETEWLSREIATSIRNEEVSPPETAELLKVYGVVESEGTSRLVTPMYAQRVADEIPTYDLQEVDDTLIIRMTPTEFGTDNPT